MPGRPRWFVTLALGCLVLDTAKHAWLMHAGPVQPWPDSAFYWQLGWDVAGGDFWLWRSATASRTPAYPWFLGACQFLGGTRALWLAVIGQHALELATSMLTAAAVWETTRSHRAVIVAYLLCLPLTARCLFANTLLTESAATFLLALLLWLFSRCLQTSRWTNLSVAAVVLGASLLLRPAAAAFLPALIWVAWRSSRDAPHLRHRLARIAAALVLCAAVVMPWCVRNQLLWGRFTVTVFLGRELWTASFSPWTGANLEFPDTESGRQLRRLVDEQSVDLRHNWSVFSALAQAGLNEVQVDDLMKRIALEAIRRQPGRAVIHVAARCLAFWYVKDWELAEAEYPPQAPWQDQLGWSSPQRQESLRTALRSTPERNFPAIWGWAAATWIGVAGMLRYAPYRDFAVAAAGLISGLTVLTAVLEVPCYRYRCVLEPAMIAAIVIGGSGILFHLRAGRLRRNPR